MPDLRRVAVVPCSVALALLLLVGCGDDDTTEPATADTTATSTTSAPTASDSAVATGLPACEEVWVDGHVLPRGYRGCDEAGKSVEAMVVNCSSGQRIVLYADHFWAVRGNRITQTDAALLDDPDYASVMASCRA